MAKEDSYQNEKLGSSNDGSILQKSASKKQSSTNGY
jgi:hypothetical protein